MLGMEDWKKQIPQCAGDGETTLTSVLASFKRYTALRANRILGRSGPFWQDESYDHLIRDSEEFEHAVWYILMNPVRARLCDHWQDWPWTYCARWLVGLL
jgi:putative transposase